MQNKKYLQVFILDTDFKIVPFIYILYFGDSPLISPTHLLLPVSPLRNIPIVQKLYILIWS